MASPALVAGEKPAAVAVRVQTFLHVLVVPVASKLFIGSCKQKDLLSVSL
jgi:hypothetical protein